MVNKRTQYAGDMEHAPLLVVTHLLNSFLMIVLPLALGFALMRCLAVRRRVYGIGMLTFLASQVVHVPLNWWGLSSWQLSPPVSWTTAVVFGLSAGVCEELARYGGYRWVLTKERTWRQAVVFGAGHAGAEAIILGVSAGQLFLVMLTITPAELLALEPRQQSLLLQQMHDYWSARWPLTLLGAVERIFALGLHLTFAVLVLQVYSRQRLFWLVVAIFGHTLVDAVVLFLLYRWGVLLTEGVLAFLTLGGLAVTWMLKPGGEEELARGSSEEKPEPG